MLAQREDGFCHFVKDKRCSIHPVKPRICRAWPYLESVLTDFTNWEAMASVCPGINKQADPQKIIAAVKAQTAADKAKNIQRYRLNRPTACQCEPPVQFITSEAKQSQTKTRRYDEIASSSLRSSSQ